MLKKLPALVPALCMMPAALRNLYALTNDNEQVEIERGMLSCHVPAK